MIEGVQKSALSIIYPEVARDQALLLGRAKQDARESPPLSRLLSRIYFSRYSPKWRACLLANPEAESCMESLQIANIARLKKRRDNLCVKYRDTMKSEDHPLNYILPRSQLINQSQEERRQTICV